MAAAAPNIVHPTTRIGIIPLPPGKNGNRPQRTLDSEQHGVSTAAPRRPSPSEISSRTGPWQWHRAQYCYCVSSEYYHLSDSGNQSRCRHMLGGEEYREHGPSFAPHCTIARNLRTAWLVAPRVARSISRARSLSIVLWRCDALQ
jgi:hypothetical protein